MIEPSLPMRVCAAAGFDIAYAASAGILLNRLWLGRSNTPASERRLRHWLAGCSWLMLASVPLQVVLLGASMTGDSSWKPAWDAVPDVLTTHAGHALAMSFCFVPVLLAVSVFPPVFRNKAGLWTGIAAVFAIAVCRAGFGHAASDGDFTFREFVQFLHLSSIAIWGGGVAVAGLVAAPQLAAAAGPEELVQFGRRLSRTVTIALVVVLLSGVYSAWRGLGGSLSSLPHTAWGRVLLLKVAIVLLALSHGGRVRLLLWENRTPGRNRTVLIRRWLRAEAVLMLVVLVVSAWLANLPPADM